MPDASEEMAEIKIEELREEIEKILKVADLTTITSKVVRQKLEKKYGRSLVKQKTIIDEIVLSLVNAMSSEEEEGENDSEDDESASENKKPAAKKEAPKKEPKEEVDSDKDDDDDDEVEQSSRPKRKAAPRSTRAKKSRKDDDGDKKPKKKGAKGGKGSGYTRTCKLSEPLAELMGEESMPRHEVVKRVWALIKEKKLYDPNNKQFAICDEALFKVIGTKRFRTFGMMKYLKSHFLDD